MTASTTASRLGWRTPDGKWARLPIGFKCPRIIKVALMLILSYCAAQAIFINAYAASIPEQARILAEEAWLDVAFQLDNSPLKATPDQGGSYSMLTPTSQSAYEKLYKGVWLQRETITFNGLSCDDIFEIYGQMKLDHPELFHLGDSLFAHSETRNTRVAHTVVTITPEYIMDGVELSAHRRSLTVKVSDITRGLRSIEDETFKARYIHDKLCSMVEYGSAETVSGYAEHSVVGLLCNGRAVCEGYALTYALLCRSAGLTCETIVGRMAGNSDPTVGHAWNRVQINGKWLYVDATFDDGVSISSNHLLQSQSFMDNAGYIPFGCNVLPYLMNR